MATITAGDFRNGKTFEMDGKVYQVVEFQHVKPGKGAAFVRTKMRNVETGAVTETSFNPTAKFDEAFVERKDMEYSYNDGDLYYFMDQETYDMVPLNRELLGDAFRFVKKNTMCKVLSVKGRVFGIEPPNFVIQELKGPRGALLEVFPGLPEYKDGYVYANDKPGLGVDLDEKEAAKYPCEKTVTTWTQTRGRDGALVTP